MNTADSLPVVWTIAGSDSGGGAGIQADLKVFNALGVHGCSVITALTAQNTCEVKRVEPVSNEMLQDQFTALKEDLFPSAVKIGMLGSVDVCGIVADNLASASSRCMVFWSWYRAVPNLVVGKNVFEIRGLLQNTSSFKIHKRLLIVD